MPDNMVDIKLTDLRLFCEILQKEINSSMELYELLNKEFPQYILSIRQINICVFEYYLKNEFKIAKNDS